MGKKRRRRERVPGYSESLLRTPAEREAEVRKIMEQLDALELTPSYPAVRMLLPLLAVYRTSGERTLVDIPLPEAGRRIQGVLAASGSLSVVKWVP